MERLGVGVIGVGRMGTVHAGIVAESHAADLRYVVDSRSEAAGEAGVRRGVPSFTSARTAAESGLASAWIIATSTPSHPALVQLGLEHGIHVLCEKPLALDTDAGPALSDLARIADLTLQVGFWRRYSPPWAAAKRLVDDGAIGRPLLVRLSQWDADPPPPAFCDPEVSGGLAIDCGVHEYDLAEWMTGRRVVRVTARNLPLVDAAVGAAGDVDNLVATLDLDDGAMAIVDLSRNARFGDDVRTEILGTDGALFVDLLPAGRTRLGTASGVAVVPGSDVDDAMRSGLMGQLSAFAAAVGGDRPPVPGQVESDRAVAIGRAVQGAASDGSARSI